MKEYFVNPDPYYTPKISIGPFSLKIDNLKTSEKNLDFFKCIGQNLLFTNSGKEAIRLALKQLKAEENHVVGIVTSSGNSYVSKCVTETITEFCLWKMYQEGTNVDILFVIHEFGELVSNEMMENLRKLDIPIVNDFAYSILSLFSSSREDFSREINISSFPKSFNINFGGVVSMPTSIEDELIKESSDIIYKKLSLDTSINAIRENIRARKRNREYYRKVLPKLGYRVVWDDDNICPGVCMVEPNIPSDLPRLKTFLQRNGIESSVFYGENKFFVPVHHLMTQNELEYVAFMIGAFADEN